MKVCVVSSGDFFSDYGGGQVYVRNIVDELNRRLEITTYVISFCKNKANETKKYNGLDVCVVGDEYSFREALLFFQPDIVHSNGEKLLSAKLCKELGIPCVVTVHHGGLVCPAGTLLNSDDEICSIPAEYTQCLKCYLRNTPTGLFWYPLLKRYSQQHYVNIGKRIDHLPFIPYLTPIGRTGQIVTQKLEEWKELVETATHFIAPSDAIAEALVRNSCPESIITIIPHGIPQHLETPHSLFPILRSSVIKFYYSGRINYIKGIHILLEAFSSLHNPHIELHIIGGVGNKTEQKYQNRLIRKYRKDKRIVWHGKLPYEQMIESIKDFHCLIHPTICLEVFGLDIAEAIQQHKYVIATRCGGAEMQIHNENEGSLVEPNNTKSLIYAIEQFLSHPRQSIASGYGIDRYVDQLISVYTGQF